jgi:hypothetical protein
MKISFFRKIIIGCLIFIILSFLFDFIPSLRGFRHDFNFLSQIIYILKYLVLIIFFILSYFFLSKTEIIKILEGENENKEEKKVIKEEEIQKLKAEQKNSKPFKYFVWTIVILLCISAITGINFLAASFKNGISWNDSFKIFTTTLIIDYYVLISLSCFTLSKRKHLIPVMIAGFTINCLGFIWSIISIWSIFDLSNDWVWQTFAIFMIISFTIAHISLLLLINPKNVMIKILSYITFFFITFTSFYLISLILRKSSIEDSELITTAILSILVLLGSIVTPIINKVVKSNN